MRKLFYCLIFISVISYSQNKDSLSGVWQDAENVGSGYSNIYVFAPDGKYWYFTNSMDCAKRLVGFSGRYKINEDVLALTVSKRYYLEGGYMVPNDGTSCGSDSMLVGASQKTIIFRKPKQLQYSISNIYHKEDRKFIYIEGMKFWLISNEYDKVVKEYVH